MNTPHSPQTNQASPGKRRRTGGRSARIQAAVFEATMQCLQEQGYEAWSFASISERTGTHESTLYRRWKTKEQLVIDVVTYQLAQDIPLPDTGMLRSDLIQFLHLLHTFLESEIGKTLIQIGIEARNVPTIRTLCKDYWQRRSMLWRPLFERALARGELTAQADLTLLLETLLGVFYARLFVLREPVDETLPERIVDLVLSGVGKSLPTR